MSSLRNLRTVCSRMGRPATRIYGFGISSFSRLPEPAAGIISVALLKILNDDHGIAKGKEAIVVLFGFFVSLH